jgi:hypothetical protein
MVKVQKQEIVMVSYTSSSKVCSVEEIIFPLFAKLKISWLLSQALYSANIISLSLCSMKELHTHLFTAYDLDFELSVSLKTKNCTNRNFKMQQEIYTIDVVFFLQIFTK